MIYFVLAPEVKRIKIGYVKGDPEVRLRLMKRDCPCELQPIKFCAGTVRDEQDLHRRLQKYRWGNEWFTWGPEVRRAVLDYGGTIAQSKHIPTEQRPTNTPAACGDCNQSFAPCIKGATNLLCQQCAFMANQEAEIQLHYTDNRTRFQYLLTQFELRQSYRRFISQNGDLQPL